MKIIQVMPRFIPAGAETMCANLSAALKAQGEEVIVVSLYDHPSALTQRMEQAGISVIFLGKKSGPDFSIFGKLYRLFRQEKPDVVHTHLYVMRYVMPGALLAGVPRIVHTFHSIASRENSASGRLFHRLFLHFQRVVPVALSQQVQKTIVSFYHLPESRVPVVLNGIPLERCIPKDCYAAGSPVSLLHVGRMTEAKNHSALLGAVRLLLDQGVSVHLTMIGDGTLREQVLETVHSLRLEDAVTWIPSTDNVFPYLHDADIFLLPSVFEGIPMSLIEAMATGLPVVAARVGGIPDMIEDGVSGILCRPDQADLARKLLPLVQQEGLRQSLGRRARAASAAFSSEAMAADYRNIYGCRQTPSHGA